MGVKKIEIDDAFLDRLTVENLKEMYTILKSELRAQIKKKKPDQNEEEMNSLADSVFCFKNVIQFYDKDFK